MRWSNDGSALYGYHVANSPAKSIKSDIATGKQTMVKELHPGVPAGVVTVAPVVVSRDGTTICLQLQSNSIGPVSDFRIA